MAYSDRSKKAKASIFGSVKVQRSNAQCSHGYESPYRYCSSWSFDMINRRNDKCVTTTNDRWLFCCSAHILTGRMTHVFFFSFLPNTIVLFERLTQSNLSCRERFLGLSDLMESRRLLPRASLVRFNAVFISREKRKT